MKKNPLLLLLILALPFTASAQDAFDELLRGSVKDGEYLVGGYIRPMMRAMGHSMNQGWYQTAAPHKFPGFDLTLSVNPVFLPSSDKLFNVDNTKLQELYLSRDHSGVALDPTGKGNMPTVFGSKATNARFTSKGTPPGSFNHPGGTGLNFFPMPTLNLGIGLPKGFDLKLRFVPTLDLGKLSNNQVKGEFGLFGVGVLHDFKQYIPGIKALPFDLSVFVGYTKMKLKLDVNTASNQTAELDCSATTIQALVSKKLAVLTAYAGLGMNLATTKIALKGTYDFGGTNVTNPITLTEAANGPRGTLGLRLKLGPIAFHGDYTLAKYKAASVGMGISVR